MARQCRLQILFACEVALHANSIWRSSMRHNSYFVLPAVSNVAIKIHYIKCMV
jgi:hypothetical protein